MSLEIPNLLVGHFVSLVGGGIATPVFLWALRAYQGGLDEKPKRSEGEPRRVPPDLTGLVERLFFTWVVAFDVSGAAPAMLAWLTLKLVSNWNRSNSAEPLAQAKWSAGALSALLAGMVSMSFAILGGLLCKGPLWQ